jgi:DNA polymerase III alpha subunit (gram-positive type)
MSKYVFYVGDTETTGLDDRVNDVIEISLYRMHDDIQKTWFLKPLNPNAIDDGALRVNGHKREDLLYQTKHGRDTYLETNKVLIDIENWMMDDGVPASNRIFVGHNASFDRSFLEQTWIKAGFKDSFPLGRKMMDTLVIELFMDICKGNMDEFYNLNTVIKKWGVKNEKAHSASADTKATKEVFAKQIEFFKKILSKNNA